VKFISPLFLLQIYSFKLKLEKDQKIIRSKIAREKRSSPSSHHHLISSSFWSSFWKMMKIRIRHFTTLDKVAREGDIDRNATPPPSVRGACGSRRTTRT